MLKILIFKIFHFQSEPPVASCKDVKKRCLECLSGIYTVHFIGGDPTKVYCDLETDNGKHFIIFG